MLNNVVLVTMLGEYFTFFFGMFKAIFRVLNLKKIKFFLWEKWYLNVLYIFVVDHDFLSPRLRGEKCQIRK